MELQFKAEDLRPHERLWHVDIDAKAAKGRKWTDIIVDRRPGQAINSRFQRTAEPGRGNCLTGFELMMRYVRYWELVVQGEVECVVWSNITSMISEDLCFPE